MSAKPGGRKPKGYVIGTRAVIYLPLYIVRSQPVAADGAKKTYHDGQKLHRLSEMTVSHGIIYEKDFPKCKEVLSKLGCKNIMAEQIKTDLPRSCPKCLQEGYPHMRPYRKIKSDRNKDDIDLFNSDQNYDVTKNIKYELHYSHSKPKLHQCHIGYWTPAGYELASGIDIKKCHHFTMYSKKEVL